MGAAENRDDLDALGGILPYGILEALYHAMAIFVGRSVKYDESQL
jgi:hypothetical protein